MHMLTYLPLWRSMSSWRLARGGQVMSSCPRTSHPFRWTPSDWLSPLCLPWWSSWYVFISMLTLLISVCIDADIDIGEAIDIDADCVCVTWHRSYLCNSHSGAEAWRDVACPDMGRTRHRRYWWIAKEAMDTMVVSIYHTWFRCSILADMTTCGKPQKIEVEMYCWGRYLKLHQHQQDWLFTTPTTGFRSGNKMVQVSVLAVLAALLMGSNVDAARKHKCIHDKRDHAHKTHFGVNYDNQWVHLHISSMIILYVYPRAIKP